MQFGDVQIERDSPVPMRDGTILRADIYRPPSKGPHPVLLQRTPYNKATAQTGVYQHPVWYAQQDYIVVVQDTRGRFASDGAFEPYRHEGNDGADTIAWASELEGSTGKVGTFGFSYAGSNQLLAAGRKPKGLTCAAIGCAGTEFYDGWTYRGGALQLAFVISWTMQALGVPEALRRGDTDAARKISAMAAHLDDTYSRPVGEWLRLNELPGFLADWIENDCRNDYWQALFPQSTFDDIEIPCLHIGGWYDIFLGGTLKAFDMLRELAADEPDRLQSLAVGPWQHVPWSRLNGILDHGAEGDNRADLLQLTWFDHWLKGKPLICSNEPVRYFLMGANRWEKDTRWPPTETHECELYLHSNGFAARRLSDGRLDTEHPDGDEASDIFVYDPREPVPSIGGASCCRPDIAPVGAYDQRTVESRSDVLVYTSAVLREDYDVVGPVELILHAATDAPDTDWTAKLVDVHPDGTAINICDGIIRARYRQSLEEPALLESGRIYEYAISMASTATRFRAGHAIRLEVSSSNFPCYDVNLNLGKSSHLSHPFDGVIATQSVFHDRPHPSRLKLKTRGARPSFISASPVKT